MLADNRDVIADILDGLADAWPYSVGPDGCWRRGAETLRYSMALDATLSDEELAELERLREFAEAVEDVIGREKVNGRREHPAAKVKAIREAYGVVA